MANKITTIVEFVTDRATSAVGKFRSEIANAEGAVGKFRAGASSAFATVQANATALALGAGAAIATFTGKSVAAFEKTALAAGKFSDQTGLAIEDASRLQEVASDLGISTGAVESNIKFLQKAIASNSDAVKTLGLETKRTKDGQVDVNATFLDAIDRLGGVKDANERALLASQLFGRGFQESAELVLGDADEIKKRLDGVAKAQVISPAQLARARKFRDQMDELADSLKQVEITVGDQLVPVIGELAEGLVLAEKAAVKLNDALGSLPGDISLGGINRGQLGSLGIFVRAAKEVKDRFDDGGDSVEVFAGQVDRMADSVNAAAPDLGELSAEAKAAADAAAEAAEHAASLGDKAANSGPKIGDMAGALDDAEQHLADLNQQARDNALGILADAAKAVGDALDESFGGLEGDLGALDLLDDIQDQFDTIAEAQKNATDPKGVRDLNREVRRLQGQLLDYLQTVDDIPPDKVTEIIAKIRTGDIDTLKATLDELTQDRFINIGIASKGIPLFQSVNASFTPGAAPSAPTFNGQSAIPPSTIDNRQITVIYPVGSTPTTQYIDQTIDQRRNGAR